jgi:hypothetical protein
MQPGLQRALSDALDVLRAVSAWAIPRATRELERELRTGGFDTPAMKAELYARKTWLASAEDVAVLKAFSDRSRDMDDLIPDLLTYPLPEMSG